jgi:hypothetical protein
MQDIIKALFLVEGKYRLIYVVDKSDEMARHGCTEGTCHNRWRLESIDTTVVELHEPAKRLVCIRT